MTAHDLDTETPFGLGQPVWLKPEYCREPDKRTFIIQGFSRGFFGGLMAHVVPEERLSAAHDFIPVRFLTDQMPPFLTPHPEHRGPIYWTATGRLIKVIDGGAI